MISIALLGEMCGTVGMMPEGISGKIIALAIIIIGVALYSMVQEESDEREEIPKE